MIFDVFKKSLFVESKKEFTTAPTSTGIAEYSSIVEEEIQGDPQALVDGMIENAPASKKQIGAILKYAAKTNPATDVWDSALAYYDTLEVGDDTMSDEPVPEPSEEPMEDPAPEEGGDEGGLSLAAGDDEEEVDLEM